MAAAEGDAAAAARARGAGWHEGAESGGGHLIFHTAHEGEARRARMRRSSRELTRSLDTSASSGLDGGAALTASGGGRSARCWRSAASRRSGA